MALALTGPCTGSVLLRRPTAPVRHFIHSSASHPSARPPATTPGLSLHASANGSASPTPPHRLPVAGPCHRLCSATCCRIPPASAPPLAVVGFTSARSGHPPSRRSPTPSWPPAPPVPRGQPAACRLSLTPTPRGHLTAHASSSSRAGYHPPPAGYAPAPTLRTRPSACRLRPRVCATRPARGLPDLPPCRLASPGLTRLPPPQAPAAPAAPSLSTVPVGQLPRQEEKEGKKSGR